MLVCLPAGNLVGLLPPPSPMVLDLSASDQRRQAAAVSLGRNIVERFRCIVMAIRMFGPLSPLPQQDDPSLDISEDRIPIIVGMFNLVAALGCLLAGPVADALGRKVLSP